ncbi:MAG TPA: type II toxin-antitoxin system RelE/ParE family toxin [Opitutales bacterium]|jgi:toxin ParE1/3/4|nr:type II toxin-antitoxin system RelE/ParE family toxin [Opitutales bacterium]
MADVIALDKPEAAKTVVRKIFSVVGALPRFRKMGRPIPEFPHPHYRQVWIAPCWIYYRFDRTSVHILHVRRAEKLFHAEDLM